MMQEGIKAGISDGMNAHKPDGEENKNLPQPQENANPENPINQIIDLISQEKKNFDISDIVSKLRNKKTRKEK